MSDLLDDQRAKDLLAADPSVVNGLVVGFRQVAVQAQTTADGLHGAAGDADWTGTAADAFRSGLGKLPGDLAKVTSSYQEAGDALDTFEGSLSSLKPAFQSIVSQLQSAQIQLTNAQNQLTSAQNSLSTAQSKALAQSVTTPLAPLKGVPLTSPLHTAVDAASGAVSNMQGEMAGLTSQGFNLLDEFDSARSAAQGRVSSASHVPPHRSFWDSFFHDVGNVMGFIFKPILNLPSAIADFAEHPSLSTFGKLAEDVGGTALIVATALAPFAAPELIAADAAEEGTAAGAEGVADAATDAATDESAEAASKGLTLQQVVDGANTVSKGAGYVSGTTNVAEDIEHGNLAEAEFDAEMMALPGAADSAGIGDQEVKEAESTVQGWQSLEDDIHELPLPSEVQSELGQAVSEGKETAEQAAKQAQYYADRYGQALDYGTEKGEDSGGGAIDGAMGVKHG